MSHHHHSYNVVVVTIAGIIGVLAIITEYFRKRKANLFVAKIAFGLGGRRARGTWFISFSYSNNLTNWTTSPSGPSLTTKNMV